MKKKGRKGNLGHGHTVTSWLFLPDEKCMAYVNESSAPLTSDSQVIAVHCCETASMYILHDGPAELLPIRISTLQNLSRLRQPQSPVVAVRVVSYL